MKPRFADSRNVRPATWPGSPAHAGIDLTGITQGDWSRALQRLLVRLESLP